jgi:hypothetical protein
MKGITALLIALALVVAACGGGSADAPSDQSPPSTTGTPPTTAPPDDVADPDAVVLQVRFEGGFLPVELAYNPAPQFVLYADGRLLFPAPIPEIFPGPLSNPFQVVQLTDARVAQVLDTIDMTRLPFITDERYIAEEGVADAADTVFTYFDDEEHRAAVYALELWDGVDPVIQPYAELVDLLNRLAFELGSAEEFDAGRYQVVVTPSFGGETEDFATIEPWPLTTPAADLPMAGFAELSCVVLEGAEAEAAGEVFAAANQATFFEDSGTAYRFVVRPLAPHEVGCPS